MLCRGKDFLISAFTRHHHPRCQEGAAMAKPRVGRRCLSSFDAEEQEDAEVNFAPSLPSSFCVAKKPWKICRVTTESSQIYCSLMIFQFFIRTNKHKNIKICFLPGSWKWFFSLISALVRVQLPACVLLTVVLCIPMEWRSTNFSAFFFQVKWMICRFCFEFHHPKFADVITWTGQKLCSALENVRFSYSQH